MSRRRRRRIGFPGSFSRFLLVCLFLLSCCVSCCIIIISTLELLISFVPLYLFSGKLIHSIDPSPCFSFPSCPELQLSSATILLNVIGASCLRNRLPPPPPNPPSPSKPGISRLPLHSKYVYVQILSLPLLVMGLLLRAVGRIPPEWPLAREGISTHTSPEPPFPLYSFPIPRFPPTPHPSPLTPHQPPPFPPRQQLHSTLHSTAAPLPTSAQKTPQRTHANLIHTNPLSSSYNKSSYPATVSTSFTSPKNPFFFSPEENKKKSSDGGFVCFFFCMFSAKRSGGAE